jgi:hypothetical protein
MLIKWSDVGNYTKWRNIADGYDPNSQAGFYRIPRGSKIIGGMQGPQQGLIWTDLGLWVMQYIGPKFIYSFNEVGKGCGLIGSRAAGGFGNFVIWPSSQGFFAYNGNSVQPLPCTVWDRFYNDLNIAQAEKIQCCVNSDFTEISWAFPSLSGGTGECDKYIKHNRVDGSWDYGEWPEGRTAWIDRGVWGGPIGAGANSFLYQHEIGYDADDQPMGDFCETGWFMVTEGEEFLFIERFIPDQTLVGNARVTVSMTDYPSDPGPDNLVTNYGPFDITTALKFAIVRGRGRMASIRMESVGTGSFWRLGKPIYFGQPAGKQ